MKHTARYTTTKRGTRLRFITYDTVTGREVDPRQFESFTGRFITQACYWDGESWAPYDDNTMTHISGDSN